MGMCLSRREKLARINAQEREQMRAVTRLGSVLLAGALALAPAMALAQQAPSSDTPATDAIGPKDLQSFSLNGTVTRAAEQPAAAAPSPQRRQPRPQAGPPAGQSASAAPGTPQIESAPAPRPARTAPAEPSRALASPPLGQVERAPERLPQPAPSSSVTVALPSLDKTGGAAPTTPAATDFAPGPAAGTLAPEHKFPVIPWLLAALILGAGGAFLFWRNRSREAFAGAGGPQVDAFVAPEPAPAPRRGPAAAPSPAPPVPKPPVPANLGIVSTRIRPWIEVAFHPLRCVLENERVMVEFELELFNSGSGPARAVLVEATLFNAGPVQDQEIGAFFANPVGTGERIVVIQPLKRVAIKTQVAVPSERMQAYELAGRQVFVPVIAFNALYRWSGGEGQTSVSYLLGRDTKGEKMGPFRLDLGPRIFRGIAGRLLPAGVRK